MNQQLAIGIDLGTTNSLVSIFHNNSVEILPLGENASNLVPSVVAYLKNGEVIVGEKALLYNNFSSVKRLIGKGINDIAHINTEHYDIDRSLSSNSILMLKNNYNSYSPVEISAQILIYLKTSAEKLLKMKITEAVITVPAHFDEAARIATKEAAKIAQLRVLRLLNEPTAAALAYGLNEKPEGMFLVYDIGGGTFDISILKLAQEVFQVISTCGDEGIGGDDFDMILSNLLDSKVKRSNLYTNEFKYKEAKKIKEYLSSNTGWQGLWCKENIDITRESYEKALTPIINKTLSHLKSALRAAGLNKNNINNIILVGGATKTPCISEIISNFFQKDIFNTINPEEIVAIGAGIQAKALTIHTNHLLLDVVPLSLGIELIGGVVEHVIANNTPIPYIAQKVYTTYLDNQTGFKIHIVQGQSEQVKNCRSIGYLVIGNLPKLPAGAVKLEILFQIDADGLLTVRAKDNMNNIYHDIVIKPSYGLNEKEILKLMTI